MKFFFLFLWITFLWSYLKIKHTRSWNTTILLIFPNYSAVEIVEDVIGIYGKNGRMVQYFCGLKWWVVSTKSNHNIYGIWVGCFPRNHKWQTQTSNQLQFTTQRVFFPQDMKTCHVVWIWRKWHKACQKKTQQKTKRKWKYMELQIAPFKVQK